MDPQTDSWAMWFLKAEAVFRFLSVNCAMLSIAGALPVPIVVLLTVMWFSCLGLAQVLAGEVATLVETEGPARHRVMLSAWTNDRLVVEGDSRRELSLDDVVSLQFDRKLIPFAGGESLILLTNGDRLVARPVSISDDILLAQSKRGAATFDWKLPLEFVASVVLDLPVSMTDRQRMLADLQTLPSGDDIVLLANGDRSQGEFEKLDGAFVELKGTTGPLKLDRSRVRAIRFNPELTSAPKTEGRRLVIQLTDGSRFTATSLALKGSDVELATPLQQTLTLPLVTVVSCHVYGGRALALADREPTEVTFVPYLATQWTLVRNANALRGPLMLRGTEFGSGLGMHSRMAASYNLNGNEREFRATVGIDDCARGAGSARFGVELDGKRVWTSDEITGRSAPLDIPPIDLRGAKRLTLVVDYGQKADVSDYGNWCDATLILAPKSP